MKEEREREREQRRSQRDKIVDGMTDSSMRGNNPKKGIDVYAKEKLAKHHFFTNLSPDILEN